LRQLTYKGHPTVRLRLMRMVDSGDVNQYTNKELAKRFHCNPRTIEAYLRDYHRSLGGDRRLEPDEYTMPLQTTSGVKVCHYKGCADCNECKMLDVCRGLVKEGNYVACESPLAKEVYRIEDEKDEN